jgi:hypothetical protein
MKGDSMTPATIQHHEQQPIDREPPTTPWAVLDDGTEFPLY